MHTSVRRGTYFCCLDFKIINLNLSWQGFQHAYKEQIWLVKIQIVSMPEISVEGYIRQSVGNGIHVCVRCPILVYLEDFIRHSIFVARYTWLWTYDASITNHTFISFLCKAKKGSIAHFQNCSVHEYCYERKQVKPKSKVLNLNAMTSTNSVSTCKINKNSAEIIGTTWSFNVNLLCWCKLIAINGPGKEILV